MDGSAGLTPPASLLPPDGGCGLLSRRTKGLEAWRGMSEEDLCEGQDQPHGPSLGGPQGAGWAAGRGGSLSLKLGAQAC